QLEGDVQGVRAVVARLRRHVQHVLDAVDLLLDRRGDRVGDHLGVGPGVDGGHADGRGRDLRVLGDRQQAGGDTAEQNDDDRNDPRQDGAGDDLVLLVDDVEDLLTLVGVEGALVDQQGLVGPADGSPDAGEESGGEDLVLVGEYTPQPHGAGFRVDLVVHEIDGPFMGE